MATLKTRRTAASVTQFLNAIENETRRKDCKTLARLMARLTGARPKMWGPSIVGFGKYHYRYESGREGDWFLTGFSPRKQDLTLYLMAGFDELRPMLKQLGNHKTGKSCLYVKGLSELDLEVLGKMISLSIRSTRKRYAEV